MFILIASLIFVLLVFVLIEYSTYNEFYGSKKNTEYNLKFSELSVKIDSLSSQVYEINKSIVSKPDPDSLIENNINIKKLLDISLIVKKNQISVINSLEYILNEFKNSNMGDLILNSSNSIKDYLNSMGLVNEFSNLQNKIDSFFNGFVDYIDSEDYRSSFSNILNDFKEKISKDFNEKFDILSSEFDNFHSLLDRLSNFKEYNVGTLDSFDRNIDNSTNNVKDKIDSDGNINMVDDEYSNSNVSDDKAIKDINLNIQSDYENNQENEFNKNLEIDNEYHFNEKLDELNSDSNANLKNSSDYSNLENFNDTLIDKSSLNKDTPDNVINPDINESSYVSDNNLNGNVGNPKINTNNVENDVIKDGSSIYESSNLEDSDVDINFDMNNLENMTNIKDLVKENNEKINIDNFLIGTNRDSMFNESLKTKIKELRNKLNNE